MQIVGVPQGTVFTCPVASKYWQCVHRRPIVDCYGLGHAGSVHKQHLKLLISNVVDNGEDGIPLEGLPVLWIFA